MSDTRLYAVAAWLNDLAALIAGSAPISDLKEKLAIYAIGLSEDFDPEVFTRKSAYAVAKECIYFPKYGELCEKLRACRRETASDHRALPGPGTHRCFKCGAAFTSPREVGNHFRSVHLHG